MNLQAMLAQQARAGIEARLDLAVTSGDTESARKIAKELSDFDVQLAPAKPAANTYGDAEIRTELNKQEWFGVDPKKSAKALEFGKTMDPKKFATPEAFAAAIVKAVDAEFTPPAAGEGSDDDEGTDDGTAVEKPARAAARRSDAPPAADVRVKPGRASGPWEKLSDAPADVRDAIRSAADKHVPASAPKEQREAYIKRALAAHQRIAEQKKATK